MTQDEIIRMALEAGIEFEEFSNYSISEICKEHLYDFAAIIAAYAINKTIPVVIAEKEAAVLAEREACAQIARKASDNCEGAEIAAVIRARSKK